MFILDGRLNADTIRVGESSLSLLLALNERRYPWLVLVPKLEGMTEWMDLDPTTQHELFDETMLASRVIRELFAPTKVNIGQLGNIVRQLHVHIVGRNDGDPAWPGSVWGHSPREAMLASERDAFVTKLHDSALKRRFELEPL